MTLHTLIFKMISIYFSHSRYVHLLFSKNEDKLFIVCDSNYDFDSDLLPPELKEIYYSNSIMKQLGENII
jgi:hypothetical protein